MKRVVHILPRLEPGGAERLLVDVSTRLRPTFDQIVVSLADRGPVARTLDEAGIPVEALGLHPSIPNPIALARLVRRLRSARPDLVHTWLYKADLLGGLATMAAGRRPLLWSVHQSDLRPVAGLRSNVAAARVCARLSGRLPTLIHCASDEVARAHESIGYRADKLRVVTSGVDTEHFRPDPGARARVRAELGIDESVPLVGFVARFDPMKDHATFAAAARRVGDAVPDARFVLCGRGIDPDNSELGRILADAGVAAERAILFGVRDDMPAVTAAFDIAVSASAFGEALSLSIAEAMATGLPCVATATGDVARLVGDTGRVVPPRRPDALADAIVDLLELAPEKRRALGARARERVVSGFSADVMARGYEALYDEVLKVSACAR